MQARFDDVKAQVSAALEKAIAEFPQSELRDAMSYATIGGKRMRAFLVMESARLHGVSDEAALPVAAAVEALHAYSLIHDDLPAMDNDDLRRGMPTCHVQWSEATAILAGDALQTLAFRLLTEDDVGDAAGRVRLIRAFSDAVGAGGMVWGQALDIAAESAAALLDLAAVRQLQGAKTGALIRFSAIAGPLVTGEDTGPLQDYATALGAAFQIADDILDVVGDEDLTGKRVGKDQQAGKATFVSLLGLEDAKSEAQRLVGQAVAALAPYGDAADSLRQVARFAIERDT